MMINVYRVQTPAYIHPTRGHAVGADVLVVAASTYCPVAPRAITAAEAVQAVASLHPSLAPLELVATPGGTMRRHWCDISHPELHLD